MLWFMYDQTCKLWNAVDEFCIRVFGIKDSPVAEWLWRLNQRLNDRIVARDFSDDSPAKRTPETEDSPKC